MISNNPLSVQIGCPLPICFVMLLVESGSFGIQASRWSQLTTPIKLFTVQLQELKSALNTLRLFMLPIIMSKGELFGRIFEDGSLSNPNQPLG